MGSFDQNRAISSNTKSVIEYNDATKHAILSVVKIICRTSPPSLMRKWKRENLSYL
jgi:hypothetical protein